MNVVTLFGEIKVSFHKASSDTVLLKGSGQIYYEKSPAGANRDTERSTDKREVSCSSTLLHLYFMNIICILLLTNSCGFQKLNSIFFLKSQNCLITEAALGLHYSKATTPIGKHLTASFYG